MQLPHDVGHFTGRHDELDLLGELTAVNRSEP
jgi:hypothetical protein